MKYFRYFLLVAFMLLGACSGVPSGRPDTTKRPLILISIDGFRADYLDRGLTPTLQTLADGGVRAEFMRPSFPSLTFPNHYTLITGLRPDRNGIVANTMEDDRIPDQRFAAANRDAVSDARWWNEGIPLWTTVQRNGKRAGTMYWPGSEAPVHGAHPDYWAPFDKNLAASTRVDAVLGWFDLPPSKRPILFTLYLNDIDSTGHTYGPDSPQIDAELRAIDAVIARLLDGLAQRGLHDAVNLVIVSDHGMTATSPDRVVYLDDLIPADFAHVVSYGVLTGISPAREHQQDVENVLLAVHEHMRCWRKSDLPERFHYGHNRRVPPLLCLANHGWIISSHAMIANKPTFSLGEHGYDIDEPDMRALFIANGPAFRHGYVTPPFDNVDVYPLLAYLLGVKPEPNDGDLDRLRPILIDAQR